MFSSSNSRLTLYVFSIALYHCIILTVFKCQLLFLPCSQASGFGSGYGEDERSSPTVGTRYIYVNIPFTFADKKKIQKSVFIHACNHLTRLLGKCYFQIHMSCPLETLLGLIMLRMHKHCLLNISGNILETHTRTVYKAALHIPST